MKIRTKVVVLLSVVFVALALVEWGVGKMLLLPRFEQIETDNARIAMKRIDYGVYQALGELQVSANDWGNWADTYRFMRDRNSDYARENLSLTAMRQLHLTVLAFVDLQGRFVWAHSVDPVSGKLLALDLFASPSIPADFPWQENLRHERSGQGLIATDQGVLLAAESPVLDGFAHGPSRGMVVMGRLLTDAEVAAIGSRAQTQVALVGVRGANGSMPQGLVGLPAPGADDPVAITEATTQVLRTFSDVYGRPLMTLRVDVPRTITVRAHSTVDYSLAFTIGAAVVVLLLMLVVLEHTVLGPLAKVTRHAVAIGAGGDLTTRLDLQRSDEIGALATEFDRMVEQVAESRRQLVDHSFEAGMAEFSRGVLHNIGNAMTPLGVRLAELQQRLRAAPVADVGRALAEHATPASDAARRADLEEFLLLASGELAEIVSGAASDAEVMARQVGVVQNALTDQLRSARGGTVLESVDLPALINQSLEIVPDAVRDRLRIEFDPSLRSLGPVRLARTVLRLVLQNLIINASEAVRAAGRERGTARFDATMTREGGEDRLLLSCVDSGVGIAAENLECIFERGYSTKREHGNLGIGLHWCATVIGALGGRIWASSDGPDTGATLNLLIPVAATALQSSEAA